ncbi:hypothetical protein BDV18DRAFT_140789 [Aspergillus unguis]
MRLTFLALGLTALSHASVPSQYLQKNQPAGDAPPSGRVDNTQMAYHSGQRDVDGNIQPESCPTIMIGNAEPGGDNKTGWQQIPEVTGFDLRRLIVDEERNATQPYYIENTKEPAEVKRVVITIAGLLRNGWGYANYVRNSLLCAGARENVDADVNSTMVVAPQWLNTDDTTAGAGTDDDIRFHKNTYQRGGPAVGPGDVKISSYEVMDQLVKTFFDKDVYPNLERVVIASHSLGAQMVHRYAMLRPTQPEDDKITFGVMNPGSYAWLVPERPVKISNSSCSDPKDYDSWHYGIGPGKPTKFPKYVREEALNDREGIKERYLSRNIYYGYGTADTQRGDHHCEASLQGDSHLERGRNFIKMLEDLPGGFPENQSVHWVDGVGHEDYKMFHAENMQRRMFLSE